MRVVMITAYPGLPWEVDWAKAAATVSDLVWIGHTTTPTWPKVPGVPFLHRNPDDPKQYQLRRLLWRPARYLGQISRKINTRSYTAAVRHIQKAHGPVDVLHAHFYHSFDYLTDVSRRTQIPYVVTEHHTSWQGHWSEPLPSPRGLAGAKRLYAHAAVTIPVCASLREKMEEQGVRADYRVIVNPVDASGIPLPADPGARDTVEVFSTGRLAPAKGYDVLLDGFATAFGKEPRLRLKVAGGGRELAALRARVADLGLDGVVEFLGPRPRAEVAERLAAADLFVLASRAENLTVAVLEALCAGLPVVTTDVGGHKEVVDAGNGRIVPSEDPDALAEAILDVARGAYDRQTIAEQARRRFSLETIGAELAVVYEAAAASR